MKPGRAFIALTLLAVPMLAASVAFTQEESFDSRPPSHPFLSGAGLGAAIGGIAGNAGMGAAIGAVAGTTAALVQKGEKVSVPSETLLEFRLQKPASLPART